MEQALAGDAASDVPCDGCTACCTSSQFVHIGPDEVATLAHIPAELLFPVPRAPAGNVLMGYDEHGHCPMLVDGECSIYEHRPRTCRTYDCRIFPATGVDPDDDKPAIARRARQWRFEYPTERDRVEQRRGARRPRSSCARPTPTRSPRADEPANATQHAVLAVRISATRARTGDATRPAQ